VEEASLVGVLVILVIMVAIPVRPPLTTAAATHACCILRILASAALRTACTVVETELLSAAHEDAVQIASYPHGDAMQQRRA